MPSSPRPAPAVSIEESISNPDFIISLINGEKFKTLKRHLRANGLTETEYRERYNLPGDYPFVAPSYSRLRSGVAHKMGFGQWRPDSDEARGAEPWPAPAPAPQTSEAAKASAVASRPSRSKAKTATGKAVSVLQKDARARAVPSKGTKAPTNSKASPVKARGKGQTAPSEASPARSGGDGRAESPKRAKLSIVFG